MKRALLAASLAASLAPSGAWAQTFELFGPDPGRSRYESPQHFALELRGGPWYPLIDSEFAARGSPQHPYQTMFGDSDRLYLGFELDWQALRINPIGTLGFGFSVGYVNAERPPFTTASGLTNPQRITEGGQVTTLNIMPGYVVAVLRLDALARRTVIPLVPYAKAGISYSLWWVNSGETLSRRNGASPPAPDSDSDFAQAAIGATLGLHLAVGVMLRLDVFEPSVQRSWDTDMGVNHSYLFIEYTRAGSDLLGSSPQLGVGSNTWTTGIALEF